MRIPSACSPRRLRDFFFSRRRRHTSWPRDWSSDVCSSDLFGIVMYAKGSLGDGPVQSQGHVHAVSPHCGWSTPELFEIWEGRAIVYGQENSEDNPGRCVAIEAEPGDRVVMPPRWAHFVANADSQSVLIFGAWCDRQYGFDYAQVRAHGGLAWFPLM